MRPFEKDEPAPDSLAEAWMLEIDKYEKDFRVWQDKSEKISKRYKLEEKNGKTKGGAYNILWSNVQTLLPAAYDSTPNPNVTNKQEGDKVAKYGAIVLEKAASHFVKTDDFDDSMQQVVLDRLLGGRGVAWVRYEPKFTGENKTQGDTQPTDGQITDDVVPDVASENVVIEFVNYKDFGHTFARTWQEVRGVWRKVYLTRDQLKSRFGAEIAMAMPMQGGESQGGDASKMQCVYEIWDSHKKQAIWLAKGYPKALDVKEDPLRLQRFFPCPRPLYATLDNSNLIPSPDYVQYQEQALELDMLTVRIGLLLKAMRVAGVYDRSIEGLQRLLTETTENKLIPVESWAMFAEKGGLKGAVDWFPLEMVASTLQNLYMARDKIKQDVYEITGMSDVIRGASNANESATAQKLKGQYASLRMGRMQRDVERFCRDLVRMIAEIVAEHFEPETIKAISGIQLPDQAMQQQAMAAQQQGQQIPPEIVTLLQKPTWDEVLATIKNDMQRCYRIDIETDSTIKADQEAEKAARIEFITAVGGFIRESATAPTELQPLLFKMLEFGAGAFNVGRDLQDEIAQLGEAMRAKAAQPQDEQPDPAIAEKQAAEQAKAQEMQAKQELEMAKMELEKAKLDMQMQVAQQEAQSEEQRLQIDVQKTAKEFELRERELALKEQEVQSQYELGMARIQADVTIASMQPQQMPMGSEMEAPENESEKEDTEAALLNILNNVTTPEVGVEIYE